MSSCLDCWSWWSRDVISTLRCWWGLLSPKKFHIRIVDSVSQEWFTGRFDEIVAIMMQPRSLDKLVYNQTSKDFLFIEGIITPLPKSVHCDFLNNWINEIRWCMNEATEKQSYWSTTTFCKQQAKAVVMRGKISWSRRRCATSSGLLLKAFLTRHVKQCTAGSPWLVMQTKWIISPRDITHGLFFSHACCQQFLIESRCVYLFDSSI